jgi:hypothetical protein
MRLAADLATLGPITITGAWTRLAKPVGYARC